MGATVVTRTVDGASRNCMKLENAWCVGPQLSVAGTPWTKLRIGIRGWWEGVSGNIGSGIQLRAGLMSGATNGPGAATCDNFIGMSDSSNSSDWVYDGGATPPSLTMPYYWGVYRTGTTDQFSDSEADNMTINCQDPGDSVTEPMAFGAEIIRASVDGAGLGLTHTIHKFCFWGAGNPTVTAAEFLVLMEKASSVAGGSWAPPTGAYNDLGVTRNFNPEPTYGELDHICVQTTMTAPAFIVCEMAAARIA